MDKEALEARLKELTDAQDKLVQQLAALRGAISEVQRIISLLASSE